MKKTLFIHATDVAKELGISDAHAYKLVRDMNKELEGKGFLIISGRVNRQYFTERIYGF